jgi:hypothetical protein
MRTVLCLLIVGAGCTVVSWGADEKEKPNAKAQAELKWARGVLTDFFDGVLDQSGGGPEVGGLLTPQYAKAFYENRIWLDFRGRYSSASIVRSEFSSNHSEVIFAGVLKGVLGTADFQARVVKEGGLWSIRHVKLRQRVE